MITPPNNMYHQERLLTRLIRQAGKRSDTPSLIMKIAADADYLRLCRSIVCPAAESDPAFVKTLNTVCRNEGLTPQRLGDMLTPAAKALGLMPASHSHVDYYRILGVHSQASLQEIKKAFRRQAVKVHPDATEGLAGTSQRFVELNDAYRTLRDPVLRRHYDLIRQHLVGWRERTGRSFPVDRNPTIFLWYSGGLLFIFIILLLVLDIIGL